VQKSVPDRSGWESCGGLHPMESEATADVQIHQIDGENSTDIHQELQGN